MESVIVKSVHLRIFTSNSFIMALSSVNYKEYTIIYCNTFLRIYQTKYLNFTVNYTVRVADCSKH